LEGQRAEFVGFSNEFDQRRGAGATIRRMAGSLFAELAESDSLLTNEIAIRSFEEHLTLCLLLGLPAAGSAAQPLGTVAATASGRGAGQCQAGRGVHAR
jgi:hypothetical protein